jgi:hypothetical protein
LLKIDHRQQKIECLTNYLTTIKKLKLCQKEQI